MKAPPLPRRSLTRDRHRCLRISKSSPTVRAIMSRQQVRRTPVAPTQPTGSIFAPGAGASRLIASPPDPQTVGLYITAQASGSGRDKKAVATIERRLSSLTWNYTQRGQPLDRKDRHIATVLAGIRNTPRRPAPQKEAVLRDDLIAMLETLDRGTLRGLRDRAILLIGFAGGLRRSEIVGLDLRRDQTEDGRGWIEMLDKGVSCDAARQDRLARGRDRPRLVSDATCPVVALETWLKLGPHRAWPGVPPCYRSRQDGRRRAAQRSAGGPAGQAHGLGRRRARRSFRGRAGQKFSGHSLRAGLASSAEVDERYVQKQLGHASAEMTRRYQRRRDRFRINLTKASGL